ATGWRHRRALPLTCDILDLVDLASRSVCAPRLRWYANHLSVLCIALQGHQAQDSGWRVSLALNTAAACRIPVVYYVADHSWVNDTIRKVPLLDPVVVPSSRDKRVLAEATIAAVVKPELERIARRI